MPRISLLAVFLAGSWMTLNGAPTAGDVARSINQMSLDPDACYRVTDLNFGKEDVHLYLTAGYIVFAKPVHGARLAALFTTDIEAGDAELLLIPPNRGERLSLANFTGSPNLDEHFNATIMVFTDSTSAELESAIKERNARKNAEMGALLADRYTSPLRNLSESFLVRLVHDVLTGDPKTGIYYMGITGSKLGNFDLVYDPTAREQIVIGQLVSRDNRSYFDTWTSFRGKKERQDPAAMPPDAPYTLDNYRIETTIQPDLTLSSTTRATLTAKTTPGRALPFWISRQMRVTSAKVDGVAAEVFQRESLRETLIHGSENEEFLVVLPDNLDPARPHELEFHHEGSVITRAGRHVFFINSRGIWYPRIGSGFARYDLSFRYPRDLVLVSTGDAISDRMEGEWRISEYRVPTPIRFAGFNLGSYNCVTRDRDGYKINVCANREVEAALKQLPPPPPDFPVPHPEGLRRRRGPDMPMPAPVPPDPSARLGLLAGDVSGALEFMAAQYGPPVLRRLTVSPIPGGFGQGFPGLIYLSTLSYLDPTQRPAGARNPFAQAFFSDVLDAHEVAHQWWGNIVTTSGYEDDWIMESLADYSALMYVEKKKGPRALDTILDRYRSHLLEKKESGQTVESSGPITWGTRLLSSHSPDSWRAITYEKGAWIIHMIRRRLGDERFASMLRDLCASYRFRPITTEEFRAAVQHAAPPKSLDPDFRAFFDNWIYGTGIPSVKLAWSMRGAKATGTLTVSGEDDFSGLVPVEIQQGRQRSIHWLHASSEGASFSIPLRPPTAGVRIALATDDCLIVKR